MESGQVPQPSHSGSITRKSHLHHNLELLGGEHVTGKVEEG